MHIVLKIHGLIQKAIEHPYNSHSATSTRMSLTGSPQRVGGEPCMREPTWRSLKAQTAKAEHPKLTNVAHVLRRISIHSPPPIALLARGFVILRQMHPNGEWKTK